MNLFKKSALSSFNTFISRISGFIRDIFIAFFFGASGNLDAFLIALRVPNFFRTILTENSLPQGFAPVFAECQKNCDQPNINHFIKSLTGVIAFILSLLVIIGIFIAPMLVTLFAPGFMHYEDKFVLTVNMLQITLPYLFFIGLVSLNSAILNSFNNFGVTSITPVFFNISLIGTILLFVHVFDTPEYGLAIGILIGGLLQFIFQLPFLKQKKILFTPALNFAHPKVIAVFILMLPAMVSISLTQINNLITTIFASFLKEGSISWLYYADRVINFPQGVFGVAIATVILYRLTRDYQNRDYKKYYQALKWGIELTLTIGFPVSIAMFFLATPILTTLFQGGNFTQEDTLFTAQSLMVYTVSIIPFMLIKIFTIAIYCKREILTPIKIISLTILINILSNIFLLTIFKDSTILGSHTLLAISAVIAAIINALLLFSALYKKKPGQFKLISYRYIVKISILNLIFAIFTILLNSNLDVEIWFELSRIMRSILLTLILTILALLYYLLLIIFKIKIARFK